MEGFPAKAHAQYELMTLDVDEFIRRFLIHVLPDGFHRIRHCGLFANGGVPTTSRERVSCPTYRRHRMTR
jgi:hypothetical protein